MAAPNGGVVKLPGTEARMRRAKIVGSTDAKLGREATIERAHGGFVVRRHAPWDESSDKPTKQPKLKVTKTYEEAQKVAAEWIG